MKLKESLERRAAGFTLDRLLRYINKDPQKNILRLLERTEFLLGGIFPKKNLDSMKEVIRTGKGVYYDFAMNLLRDTGHD